MNRCDNVTLKEQLMSLQDGFIRQTYFSDDTKELYAILRVMNEHHRHILKLLQQKKGRCSALPSKCSLENRIPRNDLIKRTRDMTKSIRSTARRNEIHETYVYHTNEKSERS